MIEVIYEVIPFILGISDRQLNEILQCLRSVAKSSDKNCATELALRNLNIYGKDR